MGSLITYAGLGIVLLATTRFLEAAPMMGDKPTASPAAHSRRPQMPARFDEQTVQQLLTDIDKPYSTSRLKVGYFLRRGQQELPATQGFALLKAAASQEAVGTKRWFLLQNLQAFAAFQVKGVDVDEGFAAYNALFAHASEAAKSNSMYALRQSVAEYVSSVPGKFKQLGLATDERTKETLRKAWIANTVLLSAPVAAGQTTEPRWSVAIEATGDEEAFLPQVEKVLANPEIPKSFEVLSTVAALVAPKDPARTLTLLKQAKLLVPKPNNRATVNQVARFYDTLVDLLVDQNQMGEAITTQQERMKLLGSGQAQLLLLFKKSNDLVGVERVLASLSENTANEDEITVAASGLAALARDAKAGGQAEALLKKYLAPGRARRIEPELEARLQLGSLYMRQHKWEQAKEVLTVRSPQPPLSIRTRTSMRGIQEMSRRVEQVR